jgi:flagella basal body P-ring formation protein FlgA
MLSRITLTLLTSACLAALECHAQDAGPAAPGAERALRERLAETYPAVTRWEISLLPPTSATIADAHPSITVTRLGERSAVWVGSRSLGADRHGTLFWFSVAGYAPAVTAVRVLTAGTPLDAQDGAVMERNILSGDCRPIEDPALLSGKRVRRLLHSGEPICADLLEPMPPVARGQEVTLLYTGHSFTLTARGVAQADGLLGKRVTVRNTSSGDLFTATVTGNAEVSVDE